MKRRELLEDLRTKDQANLVADLRTAEKKLLELQFGVTLKKVKKTDELRSTRKLIARLQTILQEQLTSQIIKQLRRQDVVAGKE